MRSTAAKRRLGGGGQAVKWDTMSWKVSAVLLLLVALDHCWTAQSKMEEPPRRVQERGPRSKGPQRNKQTHSPKEGGKVLDAYSCEDGTNRVLKAPSHEDCRRGKEQEMRLWTGDFALLQRRRTKDTQLLSCSLRATVWEGHCGFLSHWSWATVPSVVEDRLMTLSECLSAHRKGQIVLGNSVYRVKRGLTSIKVVEKGALIYDQEGQQVSCNDEPGRVEGKPEKHLKSELRMVNYELVLGEVPARLRLDTERMVVTGSKHEGVELSPLDVKNGGKADEGVTFLIDHPEHLQECPYALLRRKVRLHQYYLPGKGVGEPLSSPAGVDEKDLAGIALVGDQLAIRLESRARLDKACFELSGPSTGRVYQTNHDSILAIHLEGETDLKEVKLNKLHLEDAGDVVTAGRLDLLAFHLSTAFQNLSEALDEGQCFQNLQGLDHVLDSGGDFKTRVLPAGEAVVLSRCIHKKVQLRAPNSTFEKSCPAYLPVAVEGGQEGTPYWLEPKSRFLYKESPQKACGLFHLLPTWYETKAGDFVSFTRDGFQWQTVSEYEWTRTAKYFSEAGFNFWEDMETLGLLQGSQVDDLEIYREYGMYLTKRAAEDQGGEVDYGPLSTASGHSIKSWATNIKSTTDNLIREGVQGVADGLHLGWWARMTMELSSIWEEVREVTSGLSWLGGLIYLVSACFGFVRRLFTFCTTEDKRLRGIYGRQNKLYPCFTCLGCGGAIGEGCCIMALDSCCGDQIRKKDEIRAVVKEELEEEKQGMMAHLRELVYTEGRRRSTEDFELGSLRAKGKETS